MNRYFLELSYVGTAYHGWQVQQNAHSVQAVFNKAISTLLAHPTEVTGAGRTDTGVHASQMYCHFNTPQLIADADDFIYRLNAIIPRDVNAKVLIPVHVQAHARFDAIERQYKYLITTKRDPFQLERAWFCPQDLDLARMNKACEILPGFEDFSAFSKSRTQVKTNLCKIRFARWKKEGDLLVFEIAADRFLRNMVRAIVGTLVEIGKEQLDLDGFEQVIRSGDRKQAGFSVPAHGLYLTRILYPDNFFKN